MDMVMDMERTEDFKALRAKFQSDSNFSNALLPPTKKPPVVIRPWQSSNSSSSPSPKPKPLSLKQVPEIIPRQSSDGSSVSCPKPLRQVHVPVPEQKMDKFTYISQQSEITPSKPRALPRVRLRELSEVRKNNDRKDAEFPGMLGKGAMPVADLQKQRPASCVYPQEMVLANTTFHNTCQIWESVSSLKSEQRSSTAPPQCPVRTTSLADLRTVNDVIDVAKDKAKNAENEQAPKNPFQCEPTPFSIASPPVPPRSHMNVEKVACEAVKPIDFSPNIKDLNKASMTMECSNVWHSPFNSGEEEGHHCEEIKLPKTKSLPSIISPDTERQHGVGETELPKTKQLPSIKSLGPPPKKPPRPPKVDFSIFQMNLLEAVDDAYMTPEITEKKDTKERGPLWNHDIPKQHSKEIAKIRDHGTILTKPKMNGEHTSEKQMPQEETTQSFPGTRLRKNFSDGYVCLENLRADEKKASLGQTAPNPVEAMEEVYDDVEGLQRDIQACDAYSSFTSDIFADESNEETYEDIQSEDYSSTKSEDSKGEKAKRLGKFFRKGKFKIKNAHLKENFRNLSHSVPNLDVIAQESMVYNNVDTEQTDTNSSPRSFFKVKKYNVEKNNKMSKEEKLFREKFMYDKEITVINTAVAHCSNASTKGKLDLKITAGEQLEVIDVTEGNQLICRNSEGKYGYVLLEHLNFR
ncbi:FYN-binding protein 2 isoform X2 [Sceloporus undulatus]|nr:FYN-binding protein 2 isoform X2 [Sceloporus undulatus]